ncbi:hypothetical protein GGI15_004036 [Coemansia interrupta]|uniref:Protein kinase domain-containing protein n=1 Tax=Coemansia interrupta TaxID=1126814 RepID=A0A9W8H4M5_9FUNG|nr:hypothetical protein GGI15_004036 [Coemansia interrupta]
MPEGAIYEHLHENKVTGVPQVYASGIIVRNLFGYRLEFIILEYCGYDLNRYMTGECQRQHDRTFRRTITSVITKTFACLLHAKHVGVLHRDISAGNITVCDGKIFVIDWGYAKLIATNTGDTSHMDALAERWGFSKKTVQATENERDANIGTRVYMGIRIHSQCPQRDIMDDLESLFYVVLHTLACRENKKLVEFLGCNRQPNDVAARLKVGSMSSPDFYLKSAGIERCPGGIKAVLDRLHERLFFVDGKCIGLNLVYDDEEMDSRRELDDKFVTNIIGDVAFKEIFGCMPDLSVPQPSTATPLPMDDKVITDTLTATLVLSKSTSISRKQTADDDAGSASPKRRRY